MDPSLTVLRAGIRTLVQDLGRPGLGDIGVGRSGAADRGSLGRANVAVGNPPGAAALEVLLGGLVMRAAGPVVLALAGADIPITVDGEPVEPGIVVTVPDGAVIRLGTAGSGLRGYLAVGGGVAVPTVLGSASTDTLSGIGPAAIAVGDVLPIGHRADRPDIDHRDPGRATESASTVELPTVLSGAALDVIRGPREDWFADPALLTSTIWTVSPHSDRVGIRLTGGVLERAGCYSGRELPSEAMVPGALQVPPDGAPLLLMADHPVTGGYPVIGVLTEDAVDRAAQLRPGDTLRFRFQP